MAGLAAAQVLTEQIERVLVVERDHPEANNDMSAVEMAQQSAKEESRPGVTQVGACMLPLQVYLLTCMHVWCSELPKGIQIAFVCPDITQSRQNCCTYSIQLQQPRFQGFDSSGSAAATHVNYTSMHASKKAFGSSHAPVPSAVPRLLWPSPGLPYSTSNCMGCWEG